MEFTLMMIFETRLPHCCRLSLTTSLIPIMFTFQLNGITTPGTGGASFKKNDKSPVLNTTSNAGDFIVIELFSTSTQRFQWKFLEIVLSAPIAPSLSLSDASFPSKSLST